MSQPDSEQTVAEEGRAPRESISSGIVKQLLSEIVEAAVAADGTTSFSDQTGSSAVVKGERKRYTR